MLFALFDTETTGLPFHPQADLSKQPRIIEFAGMITDGHEILDTLEFICNPGIAIESIITEITGLKNEDLADKPPFAEFCRPLYNFFGGAVGRISHNLSFDKGMLAFDLKRVGLDLDCIQWNKLDKGGRQTVEICTVEQTYHAYGRRQRLQDLYKELIGPYVQKHRALDDVKLLHEVCKKIGVYEAFNKEAA